MSESAITWNVAEPARRPVSAQRGVSPHPVVPGTDKRAPRQTAASGVTSSPVFTAARPILVVDEDPVAALLIRTCLTAAKLTNPVSVLADGEQAMAVLDRSVGGHCRPPALVLLDGKLPGVSGLDLLTWMRLQPVLREVPVLFLTGDDSRASVRAAYAAGAASYLVKPVAFEALTGVLQGLGLPWTLA